MLLGESVRCAARAAVRTSGTTKCCVARGLFAIGILAAFGCGLRADRIAFVGYSSGNFGQTSAGPGLFNGTGTLYSVNTSTGVLTAIGSLERNRDGPRVDGLIWGSRRDIVHNQIDTITTASGTATVGSSTDSGVWGLGPDPLPAGSAPEPATWSVLALALSAG